MPKSLANPASELVQSTAPTMEEAKSALEQVVSSQCFQRADRLRSLLRYVCEATLRGEGPNLNEHMIGLEVFHRGSDYSPSEDAIVRRMAHALRQKLDRYYSHEGAADPVWIEVPPGHYVAQFRPNIRAVPAQTQAVLPARTVALAPRWSRTVWMIVAACALLGGGLLLGKVVFDKRHPPTLGAAPLPPPTDAIWDAWRKDPAGATICFSNPMTMMVHQQTEMPASSRYPVPGGRFTEIFRKNYNLPNLGKLYWSPDDGQGKLGEAMAAVTLTAFLGRYGIPVRATQSRSIGWDDFRRENLILFGHQEINPYVEPLLDRYPLRQDGNHKRIVNTSPLPGEQPEYELQRLNSAGHPLENYALISMIPAMDAHRKLLLITGLQSPAAGVAAEFLTDPAKTAELVQRLHAAAPPHKEIRFFQVLLKAYIRNKVPTEGSIVIVRVL